MKEKKNKIYDENKKTGKVKGYLTVEASLIVPVVILLICFVFHCTYYLYNKCVISQDAYILAFRGSTMHRAEIDQIKNYIEEEEVRQFGNKYFSREKIDSRVEVSTDRTEVEAAVSVKTFLSEQFFPYDIWKTEIRREAERICPVVFIRRVRRISN